MDPRVLQAAERVLAFARAQVIAGLNARLAPDGDMAPIDDDDTLSAASDTSVEDAPIGH